MKKILLGFFASLSVHAFACGLNKEVTIEKWVDENTVDLNKELGIDDSCKGQSFWRVEVKAVGNGLVQLVLDGKWENQAAAVQIPEHQNAYRFGLYRFTTGPVIGENFSKMELKISGKVYISTLKAVSYKDPVPRN